MKHLFVRRTAVEVHQYTQAAVERALVGLALDAQAEGNLDEVVGEDQRRRKAHQRRNDRLQRRGLRGTTQSNEFLDETDT